MFILETTHIVNVVIVVEHNGSLLIARQSFANKKPYDVGYIPTSCNIVELWKNKSNGTLFIKKPYIGNALIP